MNASFKAPPLCGTSLAAVAAAPVVAGQADPNAAARRLLKPCKG